MSTTPDAQVLLITEALAESPRSLWHEVRDRIRRSRPAWISFLTVCAFVLVALLAFTPLLTTRIETTVGGPFEPPSIRGVATLLGTDHLGRSVVFRLLYGTRVALVVSLSAAVIAAVVGSFFGVLAGYFGRWIDTLVIWLFSTLNSIPWILLMTAMAYALKDREMVIFGQEIKLVGVPAIIIALGLTSWVDLCRLVRGETIKLRERDFIAAARAMGLGNSRILFRHLLPNVSHIVIIDFTLNVISFIQAEVVLSFLGLGIVDQPSWGRAIDDGKLELMRGVWWQMAGATFLIFLLSLALNILGDALRDAMDPRLRGRD
ncbi:MAG: ABC transporter permease [Tepidisphaeraceae bacterium]|jgi:peptide/nickel transport system permease protein